MDHANEMGNAHNDSLLSEYKPNAADIESLKMPITTILTMADSLKLNKHLPHQLIIITGILRIGTALFELVNAMGSLNNNENNSKSEVQDFQLKNMIETIIQSSKPFADTHKNEIILSCPENITPATILANKQSIQRALMNLINNAIQFTQDGYIIVSVDISKEANEQLELQVTIEDTGIGIAKHNLDLIFQRFYTVENTGIAQRHINAGLGLAHTKELVEHMGGKIGVNSRLGCGSVFWFTFPAKNTTQANMPEKEYPADRSKLQNVNILLVDDHIKRGRILERHLDLPNITLIKSSQAIKEAKEADDNGTPYDIILIDDEIKSSTPLKLANYIMQSDDLLHSPLLLMLTSIHDLNYLEKIHEAGCYKVLQKPISTSECLTQMTQAWETWSHTKNIKNTKGTFKTLLIEDNPLGRKITESMLTELNATTDMACSGEEALKLTQENKYDLIYIDIGLPDIDGLTVAEKIKQFELNKATPLIALTAHAEDEYRRRAFEVGISDFIIKPAKFNDIKKSLELSASSNVTAC